MDAARLLDLLSHLENRGIPVWLDGGWAIDALLSEQTRQHDDFDLVSRLEDSAGIEEALGEGVYVLAAGRKSAQRALPPTGASLQAAQLTRGSSGMRATSS